MCTRLPRLLSPLLLSLLLGLGLPLPAQEWVWVQPGPLEGNEIRTLDIDAQGRVAIGGWRENSGFLGLLSASGSLLWERRVTGQAVSFTQVRFLGNRLYFSAYDYFVPLSIFGQTAPNVLQGYETFIGRVNPDNQVGDWLVPGPPGADNFLWNTVFTDGGIYAGGKFGSSAIARYDADGNFLWKRAITGSTSFDNRQAIVGIGPDGSAYGLVDSAYENNLQRALVIGAFSAQGDTLWRHLSELRVDRGDKTEIRWTGLAADSSGAVYVCGGFKGLITVDTFALESELYVENGIENFRWASLYGKLDSAGHWLWLVNEGNRSRIPQLRGGDRPYRWWGEAVPGQADAEAIVVAYLDSSVILRSPALEQAEAFSLMDVALSDQHQMVMGGHAYQPFIFAGNTYQVSQPDIHHDLVVIKTDPQSVQTDLETGFSQQEGRIWPSPSYDGLVSFRVDQPGSPVSVHLYNAAGQLCGSEISLPDGAGITSVRLSPSLSRGLYLLTWQQGDRHSWGRFQYDPR